MPKEIVGRRPTPETIVSDSTDGPRTERAYDLAVEVSWGRDKDVHISTVNYVAQEYSEQYGWFVTLQRHEINRLIKALRKARDQAYGADE